MIGDHDSDFNAMWDKLNKQGAGEVSCHCTTYGMSAWSTQPGSTAS